MTSPDQTERVMKRVLVSMTPDLAASVERAHERGVSNKRFGGASRSLAETLRRLVIEGLEQHEEKP